MPPINITTKPEKVSYIANISPKLTEIIAEQLSCSDLKIHINKKDIKINIFSRAASFQSADTRVELYAYPCKERVHNSDSICINIRDYMLKNCPGAGSVDVFLYLTDLSYGITR